MKEKIKEAGNFVLGAIRDAHNKTVDETREEEWERGLINAINCMIDLGIPDDNIINKTTLYWNIKPSFVRRIIDGEKEKIKNKEERR